MRQRGWVLLVHRGQMGPHSTSANPGLPWSLSLINCKIRFCMGFEPSWKKDPIRGECVWWPREVEVAQEPGVKLQGQRDQGPGQSSSKKTINHRWRGRGSTRVCRLMMI
eukprot:10709439-Ditylum_brightwellii.AAC.1